jgi:N-ethylmaleimide reductase
VVRQLAPLGLAYVHIIEGATGGPRDIAERPFDYAALKRAYLPRGRRQGRLDGEQRLRQGAGGAVLSRTAPTWWPSAKPYIANPDLVERLRADAPLNAPDKATFYGGGAKGYTDYPALAKQPA